jgi:uncharacterized protein (DUF433 family)
MSVATTYEHITINKNGVAAIKNTNTKVVEIVLEMKAYGWSPEEIHFQHPYLSLGQIYSALAYYFDHIEAFENDIAERLKKVEKIKAQIGASDLAEQLKKRGAD